MKYDLVDRRCVVTGATSGIGKEIARNLAYFGATVVLACRDRDLGSLVLQELADDSGNDMLTMQQVDLSNQASIRQFAHRVTSGGAPVDVLVNCAGVMMAERRTTTEGHEVTWATNALAYFMLTNLLLPSMAKIQRGRIVNVAAKEASKLDLGDLEFERRRFSGADAYAQSKQAVRMLSWGLANRLSSGRISVHACDPGNAATGLYRHQSGMRSVMRRIQERFMATPAAGALTPTFLAADPDVHQQSGKFWVGQKPVRCPFRDSSDIEPLWKKCVEMTRTDIG